MEIAPGVRSLGDSGGGYVRAYLLDDGRDLTLVDTLSQKDGHLLFDELRQMRRPPTDVKRIILTHAHPSHLMGVAAIKKATGARLYSHDWEADIVAGQRKAEVPKTTTLWPQKPLKIYKFQVGLVLGLGKHEPADVDENLKDGDHAGPLTVMHVPGHTPGSLAFWWAEKRLLIAGDIVSTWPEVALGWPQITLDNKQNRESVGKLTDVTNAEIVCTGHGDAIVRGGNDVLKDLVAGRAVKPELAQGGK